MSRLCEQFVSPSTVLPHLCTVRPDQGTRLYLSEETTVRTLIIRAAFAAATAALGIIPASISMGSTAAHEVATPCAPSIQCLLSPCTLHSSKFCD